MSQSKLIDFDWSLQYVLGTSAISATQEPLLLVHFHINDTKSASENEEITKTVSSEMTLQDLDNFITSIEQVLKD